mgnify:CR=1 FL=1
MKKANLKKITILLLISFLTIFFSCSKKQEKRSKKFAGLKFIPTFAIPKSKQPLALGLKETQCCPKT